MKLSKNSLLATAMFAMSFALAGCPEEDSLDITPPTLANNTSQNGIDITTDKVEFAHEVGKTECPQRIGIIKIVNKSGKKVRFTIERDDRIGTGAVTPSSTSGDIASNADANVELAFNCSQTEDVSERWVVRVFDEQNQQIAHSAINLKGEVWMN